MQTRPTSVFDYQEYISRALLICVGIPVSFELRYADSTKRILEVFQ